MTNIRKKGILMVVAVVMAVMGRIIVWDTKQVMTPMPMHLDNEII